MFAAHSGGDQAPRGAAKTPENLALPPDQAEVFASKSVPFRWLTTPLRATDDCAQPPHAALRSATQGTIERIPLYLELAYLLA